MTHGGRQARTAAGWRVQVRETPHPQGGQAHASPRGSAKFHLSPPEGARGQRRGRGRGTPEGAARRGPLA